MFVAVVGPTREPPAEQATMATTITALGTPNSKEDTRMKAILPRALKSIKQIIVSSTDIFQRS
jgi:hypothetical protein